MIFSNRGGFYRGGAESAEKAELDREAVLRCYSAYFDFDDLGFGFTEIKRVQSSVFSLSFAVNRRHAKAWTLNAFCCVLSTRIPE